jgi:uncharacterized membrane protein YphA (DoxX/SURF4 family)/thiol-disulfide isomerase/thioredoxin
VTRVSALLLSARCVLAVVFLVAAVGKLLDLNGSRQAIEGFGVPARVARVTGPILPFGELAVVALVLIRPTAIVGAAGALLLLLVFIAGVSYAMSQGRAPDCHCFGQLHSEPAGAATIVRNVALAGLAAVILAGGAGPSIDGGLGSLDGTQVALVVVSALAAVLLVGVAQLWSDRTRLKRDLTRARVAGAVPGLPRGTPAPEFELPVVVGSRGSLADLRGSAGPTVLVFASTRCGPCIQMLPTLARWQESLSDSLALATIFSGERQEIEKLCEEHQLSLALAQENDEIFTLYKLRATPSGVLVDADGAIASLPAEGVPAIEALVRSSLAGATPARLALHPG